MHLILLSMQQNLAIGLVISVHVILIRCSTSASYLS